MINYRKLNWNIKCISNHDDDEEKKRRERLSDLYDDDDDDDNNKIKTQDFAIVIMFSRHAISFI